MGSGAFCIIFRTVSRVSKCEQLCLSLHSSHLLFLERMSQRTFNKELYEFFPTAMQCVAMPVKTCFFITV